MRDCIRVACILALLAACGPDEKAEPGFALGAFPPVLSDTEYHERSWTRDDCMVCHEDGEKDSPVVRHPSGIVDAALKAKCRTCHVFVPGYHPED